MTAGSPALLAALALVACNPTLPAAPPHANVAPHLLAPPFEVCWVEYVRDHEPAGYGLAGSSDAAAWEVTFSGLLVRHPRGHLLVDAGRSSHFAADVATAGPLSRSLLKSLQGGGTEVATAPAALGRVGEDVSALRAVVISHIHGDHVGGLLDLPPVPVILSPLELAFLRSEKESGDFNVVRAYAVAIEARAEPIKFTRTPYENFDESADYYGDGSVVFVPLPGHTPGSVGTFVNRSASERYFHVGDATNTLEAVRKVRGKSFALGITDHDAKQADATVAKLAQLHAQDPSLTIVPAHDRTAWVAAFGAPGTCLGAPRASP